MRLWGEPSWGGVGGRCAGRWGEETHLVLHPGRDAEPVEGMQDWREMLIFRLSCPPFTNTT